MLCRNCGTKFTLRSFRLSSFARCPHCGQRGDPVAFRATWIALSLVAALPVIMAAFGWIGLQVGLWIGGNKVGLCAAFLGALDGLWFSMLLYVRWTDGQLPSGSSSVKQLIGPLTVGLIAGMNAHGPHAPILLWGFGNCIVSALILRLTFYGSSLRDEMQDRC